MSTPSLLITCGSAFVAVFVVLTFLAALMRGLIRLFPATEEQSGDIEPALVTAVTTAVTSAFPGTRVARIEEVK